MSQLDDLAGAPITDPFYRFPWQTLEAIVEGRSAIDLTGLRVSRREAAVEFLRVYGLDPTDPLDEAELETIAGQARHFIEEVLLPWEGLASVPPELPATYPELLLLASTPDHPLRDWACSFLKVSHAVAHARFTQDPTLLEAARAQIFERFSVYIRAGHARLIVTDGEVSIPLVRCDFKPHKPWESLVLKLLHKVDSVAQEVYDHLGVRFVTPDKTYALLLLKFLRSNNVFAYPNVKPSRSVNTLVDLAAFRGRFDELEEAYHQGELTFREFTGAVHQLGEPSQREHGRNPHSSAAYQTMQFTARALVRVPRDGGVYRAFIPFEVQIMDEAAYLQNQGGEAAHHAYRVRQRLAVCRRVFPWHQGP
ncbi:MAG: TIGR04552 family protein [Candidatus Sericytochromatia bacterium]|nr:TIGR04552 family protein [Candidatus Sericytochromatia bacterium]